MRTPYLLLILVLSGVLLLGLRSEALAGTNNSLAFIEVDPASTTAFRERGTHRPFVAVGLNYFDPQTGWAPKLWQQFNEERVAHHLDLIQAAGFNTLRVFLTDMSFHIEPGKVAEDGLKKLRTFLRLCHDRHIYVILVGPDTWEGAPPWRSNDRFADPRMLEADEAWWRAFGSIVRDEPCILAYDLLNEPTIPWDTPSMREAWRDRLVELNKEPDRGTKNIKSPPSTSEGEGIYGKEKILPSPPDPVDAGGLSATLIAYQKLREDIGQKWTKRRVAAIRDGDRNHLITIGHIQWAAPILLPGVASYSGFDLKENAKLLDFMTIHFYPLDWPKPCDAPEGVWANAIYLRGVLMQADVGKPLMLGEFGWYGGGPISANGKEILPSQTAEQQLEWDKTLLNESKGHVCGWLNWAFADTPTSTDLTRWSGCWTTDLQLKPWGRFFSDFAREATRQPASAIGWPARLTSLVQDETLMKCSPAAANAARRRLREASTQPER